MEINDNPILISRKWDYTATMAKGTKRVAAFFDVDGAVVAGSVADAFEQRRRDIRSLLPRRSPDVAATVATWRGKEVAEVEAVAGKVFAKRLADRIYPEARALIAGHRRQGHTVVLTSGATRQQVQPLA